MWMFCLHVCLSIICIWCLQRPEEASDTIGTEVTDTLAAEWVLRIKPGSSAIATSSLNH